MSMTAIAGVSLETSAMQAYFAPVDRTNAITVPFDPGSMGRFALNNPPLGWFSAGQVLGFKRTPQSTLTPVLSGAPAVAKVQTRTALAEEVQFEFSAWSRIGMVLSAGVQTMNLLATQPGANANSSGAAAAPAETLLSGSTASLLQLAAATTVQPGDIVVVDQDYTGQTGYLGTGAPGAYFVNVPSSIDADFIRRVSFNVSRVLTVASDVVTLAASLPAGNPASGMKVSRVMGFVDRAGGAFAPEWSGLFVLDGFQGDRLLLHYPRLQPAGGEPPEVTTTLAPGVNRWRPAARLRALPVADSNDGAASVCFRSYLPAPMRLV